MRTLLIAAALFLLVATSCAHGEEFSSDIKFSPKVDFNDVTAEIQETGKVAVIFATEPWCGACNNLKKALSGSASAKKLLNDDRLLLVQASGGANAQWQHPGESEGYVPRVYFLKPDGKFHTVAAPNPDYKHFLASPDQVTKAIKEVLAATGTNDEAKEDL